MESTGKMLVLLGLAIVALGALLWSVGSVPLIGKLPGDLYIRRGTWSLYFPITTSIVLSVVLTLVMWINSAFRR